MIVIDDIKGIICSPNVFLSKEAGEQNVSRGIHVLLLTMLLSLIYELPLVSIHSNSEALAVTGLSYWLLLPLILIAVFIGIFIWIGINHLSAKLLGCTGSYKSLTACLLFSQAISIAYMPFITLGTFFASNGSSFGSGLVTVANLVATCWGIYLYILTLRKVYSISIKKAICIMFAPITILVIGFVCLLILFEGFFPSA